MSEIPALSSKYEFSLGHIFYTQHKTPGCQELCRINEKDDITVIIVATCSTETIRRVLREYEFNGRVARKEPFISKKPNMSIKVRSRTCL